MTGYLIRVYIHVILCTHMGISPTYIRLYTEVLLKMPIASRYSAFALRNTAKVTIHSLPRSSTYEMATYSNGAFNQNPRSDSRHAPSTRILIQDVPACFASRRFLKRRLTADIRLSAFSSLRPLCSLSLPGARFSYE